MFGKIRKDVVNLSIADVFWFLQGYNVGHWGEATRPTA